MAERDPESRAIYVLLILTMSPVVVATIIERGTFGGGSTLSLIFAAVGGVGLFRQLRAAPDIPRACTHRSLSRGKR